MVLPRRFCKSYNETPTKGHIMKLWNLDRIEQFIETKIFRLPPR